MRLESLNRQAKGDGKIAMNATLRQLVERLTVDPKSASLNLEWKHGGSTSVIYGWPTDEPAGPREMALGIK